jgi:hypothetical protein
MQTGHHQSSCVITASGNHHLKTLGRLSNFGARQSSSPRNRTHRRLDTPWIKLLETNPAAVKPHQVVCDLAVMSLHSRPNCRVQFLPTNI